MQTFVPLSDYTECARVLDRQRLIKQMHEGITLHNGGWPNHPASKMWRLYPRALGCYLLAVANECLIRGYQANHIGQFYVWSLEDGPEYPNWWGREDVHASHRSNLLRKLPQHYSQFNWTEPDNLPYVWPEK